jgi:hydrogenase/urease accessory protein HupE
MAGVVLTATGARTFLGQKVLRPDDAFRSSDHRRGGGARHAAAARFPRYARLGVEHILTGFDHLLFCSGCWSPAAVPHGRGIVTCFTVAHSVTLALAALDVVTLPSRVVEPLIAATIVFVGVENLIRGDEPKDSG